MERIYLDYAATTPTDPQVIKAMEPYFYERFGNASSPHSLGQEARKALEDARETLAQSIGARRDEIIFTSGATESNNHAVCGAARANKEKGNHIIVSSIEHHSVLEPVARLQKEGFQVSYIEVDSQGVVNRDHLRQLITGKTVLVAVIHASNEIGTIQPLNEIGRLVKEKRIHFHVDAVQTVGHVPLNVNDFSADTLSLSAHKFYGPKGIGALYIRKGTKMDRLLLGGDQEDNQRASTQNVPGAVGLAQAIAICAQKMKEEAAQQITLRDYILEEVPKRVEGVNANGHIQNRLPNNAHFSFENLQGEALLMSLDMNGIAASMGSACTSGALESSHVLRAIGLSDDLAFGSLRITLGRWTTKEQVDYFLDKLPQVVKRLRL